LFRKLGSNGVFMVLFQPYIGRVLRRLHYHYSKDPVDDQWRGWNWDRPPLRPRGLFGLSIGDVVNEYCPVRRDVWIRKVLKLKPRPSRPLIIGKIIHTIFHMTYTLFLEAVVKYEEPDVIYSYMLRAFQDKIEAEGVNGDDLIWATKLFKKLAYSLIGYMCIKTMWHPGSRGYEGILWLTEYHVDGSILGLSKNLRVDATAEGIVVEIKYGKPLEFHKHALAGYALALEAEYETPFNYGLIVYIDKIMNGTPEITYTPVYINTILRMRFIEKRDQVIDMLFMEKEPKKPLKNECPESCPYYYVCWGGGS